jgi:hypothetical protein
MAAKTPTQFAANDGYLKIFLSLFLILAYPADGAKDALTRRYSWHMRIGVDYGASSRDNDIGYVLAYLSCSRGSWLGSLESTVII